MEGSQLLSEQGNSNRDKKQRTIGVVVLVAILVLGLVVVLLLVVVVLLVLRWRGNSSSRRKRVGKVSTRGQLAGGSRNSLQPKDLMVVHDSGTTGGYQLHISGPRCSVLLWRLRCNRQSRMELAWNVAGACSTMHAAEWV